MATKLEDKLTADVEKAQDAFDKVNNSLTKLTDKLAELNTTPELVYPKRVSQIDTKIVELSKPLKELSSFSSIAEMLNGKVDPRSKRFKNENFKPGDNEKNRFINGEEWLKTPKGKELAVKAQELIKLENDLLPKIEALKKEQENLVKKTNAEFNKLLEERKRNNALITKQLEQDILNKKKILVQAEKELRKAEAELRVYKAQVNDVIEKEKNKKAETARKNSLKPLNTAEQKKLRAITRNKPAEKPFKFTRLTGKAAQDVLSGKKKLLPGQMIATDAVLDTGINDDLTRRHKASFVVNGKTQDTITINGQQIKAHSPSKAASGPTPFFGKDSGDNIKSLFGTAHHKIGQDISEGKLKVENNQLSLDQLKSYLKSLSATIAKKRAAEMSAEEKELAADISPMFNKDNTLNEGMVKTLLNTINQELVERKNNNLDKKDVKEEKTHGAVFALKNGELISFIGTTDIEAKNRKTGKTKILDKKTSSKVDSHFGIQLSTYNLLLKAAGIDTENEMGIIHTPMDGGVPSSTIAVKPMADGKMNDLWELFLKLEKTTSIQAREKLQQQMRDILGYGGVDYNLVTKPMVDKDGNPVLDDDGNQRTINYIGGKTLQQWGEENQLENLMGGIQDPETKRHIENLIFKRVEGRRGGGFLYDRDRNTGKKIKAFDNYRKKHRPELMDIPGWMSDDQNKYASEGNGGDYESSSNLGGLSPTEWYNYINSFPYNSKEQLDAIDQMLSVLNMTIVGAGNDETSKLWASNVHWSERFITSLLNRSQYIETDTEKGKKAKEQSDKITDLVTERARGFGNVKSFLDEQGELGSGQRYSMIASRTMQEYIDSITGRTGKDEDEDLNDVIESYMSSGEWGKMKFGDRIAKLQKYDNNQVGRYTKQLPHRLSRLFLASKYYDQVWKPEFEENKELFNNNYDLFLEEKFRINPAIKKQYQSSQKAAEWLAVAQNQMPGATILEMMANPELIPEGAVAKFGDHPEAMNLISLIQDMAVKNPDLLKSDKINEVFNDQMGGKKFDWWNHTSMSTFIKAGVPIDNLLHFVDQNGNPRELTESRRAATKLLDSSSLQNMLLFKNGKSVLESEDADAASAMWGANSDIFGDINDRFHNAYTKWKEAKYDSTKGVSSIEEDKALSMSKFFASEEGQKFLQEQSALYNPLIEYRSKQADSILKNNAAATKLEQDQINARHERIEAAKANAEKRALAEEATESISQEKEDKNTKTEEPVIEQTTENIAQEIGKAVESSISNIENVTISNPGQVQIAADKVESATGTSSDEKAEEGVGVSAFGRGATSNARNEYFVLKDVNNLIKEIEQREENIRKNNEVIDSLKENQTKQARDYVKSLEEQNNFDKQTIEHNKWKIKNYQDQGKPIDDLVRNYEVRHNVNEAKYGYTKTQGDPKGSRGGSNYSRYYSIEGRTSMWIERMINGGAILKLLNTFKKGLKDAIKIAQDLDKSMTNIRIVTGKTQSEAMTLTGTFIELSQKLGVTSQEVLKSATEFYRQGYETAEVTDLVTSSMKLAKLGMIDAASATKDITSAIKGFKLATTESIDVVDKLTAIDMKAATSAGDIAEGLSQFANLANVNGVNIDQAAAMVATIADVTQNSGSAVGSSLKMIMSRFGNVKAGAYNKLNLDAETVDEGQAVNDVEKVLKKLGISIRDANLNFKDFDEVLDEVAAQWNNLDNVSKRAISTAFAGTRQQEAFLTLMQNYDKYQELLDVSKNSEGTADKKYQSFQESYEAAKNELNEALKELVNSANINKTLVEVTKMLTSLIKKHLPRLIKWLPMVIHGIADIRALFGKSLIQKVITGIGQGFEKSKFSLFKANQALATSTNNAAEALNTLTQAANNAANADQREADQSNRASEADANEAANSDKASQADTQEAVQSQAAGQADSNEAIQSNAAAQADANEATTKKGRTAGTGLGAVTTGLTMALSSVTSALTTSMTAATTHKYGDEIVESSAEAQKAGGAVAGALASLPFGIGSLIDLVGGFSEKVAAEIDAERDRAAASTKRAEKIISQLSNMDSHIESLKDVAFGSEEFKEEIRSMISELYDSDNKESRDALEQYLGGPGSLQKILENIESSNEATAKNAYKQLQIAELEVKKSEIAAKKEEQQQRLTNSYNDAYATAKGIEGEKPTFISTTGGKVTAIAGSLGAFATAAGIFGATQGWNPVGWGALIIAGLAGIGAGIAGIVEGNKEQNAKQEVDRLEQAEQADFNTKTVSQRIIEVEEKLDNPSLSAEQRSAWEECLSLLKEQNAISNQIVLEMNEITAQQAILTAEIDGKLIQDMSQAELKALGDTAIIEAYAEALVDHGLIGTQLFSNGKLTELGYDYALSKILEQNDEEITSILSGQAYTLFELLEKANKTVDSNGRTILSKDQEIDIERKLQAFATSLGITVDELVDAADKFGSLTLGDTYKSAQELSETLSGYTSLLESINNGAGDTSSWMNTIINQFPELIAYMGDLPTLFAKIGKKVQDLSQMYLKTEYRSVSGDSNTFKEIESSFYSAIGNETIADKLREANVSTIEGITDWLKKNAEYDENGQMIGEGKVVLDALKNTVDQFGMSITSSVLKNYYDQLITFKTQTLDTEINNLEEQKSALQDINKQREYENQLIEAKLKLENASKEKKRVYRAGVGWVYESDQQAILNAQENLTQVQNQKTISELQTEIDLKQQQKDELENIYNQKNYETLQDFYDSVMGEHKGEDFYSMISEGIAGITALVSEEIQNEVDENKQTKDSLIEKTRLAWNEMQRLAGIAGAEGHTYEDEQAYNAAVENYHSISGKAINAGATAADFVTKGDKEWASSQNTDALLKADVKGQSAYDFSKNDKSGQELSSAFDFVLKEPGSKDQHFEGSTDMTQQISGQVAEWIWKDMKHNKAWLWESPSKAVNPNSAEAGPYRISSSDENLYGYVSRLRNQEGLTNYVITGWDGDQESVYVDGMNKYRIVGTKRFGDLADDNHDSSNGLSIIKGKIDDNDGKLAWREPRKYMGDLSFKGGGVMINELGTEAIVTPNGTLTALPSKTGIVPADITKNLWDLGEVAPSIMRTLGGFAAGLKLQAAGIGSTDESFNIGTINMTVNADDTFDADAFVESVKARASLTRNTNR